MTSRRIPVCVVQRAGLGLRDALGGRRWYERGLDLLRLQMIRAMEPHLPPDIELRYTNFASGFWNFDRWLPFQRPAIFILLKFAAYGLSPEQVWRLKEKAIAVGVDHIDGDLSQIDLAPFDFHISTSIAGKRALDQLLSDPKTNAPSHVFAAVLHQSPDSRLEKLNFPRLEGMSAVYVGLRKNSFIPENLERDIDVFEVLRYAEMGTILPELPKYNLHFAVRPDARPELKREYKPFTKGMIAAACHANVIVNKDVDDVIDLLTTDYPYLVPSNDPAAVERVFRQAENDFGGPEWQRGLEIVTQMRARVAIPQLAEEFASIIQQAV